jgi:ribosomal protein L37E
MRQDARERPMPYVTCRRCGLTVYSAARFTSIDRCPGCGAELDRRWRDESLHDTAERERHRQAPRPDGRAPSR